MKLFSRIWPSITDIESANKASRQCYLTVWGLSTLSVTHLVVSCYWIAIYLKKELSIATIMVGYLGILFFSLLGYLIKRHSKIAVLLPLAMMILFGTGPDIVVAIVQLFRVVLLGDQFRPLDYGSWYGIASAIFLLVVYLNGIRGVFAYHRFSERAAYDQRINDDGRWAF